MTLDIRRASIDDLETLLPLVAGYREFYKQDVDPQAERAFVAAHLTGGSSTVFLARLDERAVGFVQLFPAYSTVRLRPTLILEDLFVSPEARNHGVASKLLRRASEYASEIGAAGMFLETAMDNVTAQAVYERNGWTREAEFYKYNAPAK
jgi:ribosomal protein S18 acetylase RimI-like enzyme